MMKTSRPGRVATRLNFGWLSGRLLLVVATCGLIILGILAQTAHAQDAEEVQLRLSTYPDRHPIFGDTADRSRPLLLGIVQGEIDLDGLQGTLYVDGEASASTFTIPGPIGGLIANVEWSTEQTHNYRLAVGDHETDTLRINWTDTKPIAPDPETYIPDIPGAYTLAAGLVPLVLAGVVFMAWGSLPAIVVFYLVFGAMAIASPVHPALWLTVLLSAVGMVFMAFALGFSPRRQG